jgi:hypothetical protein
MPTWNRHLLSKPSFLGLPCLSSRSVPLFSRIVAFDLRCYSLKCVSRRQRNQDIRSGVLRQFYPKMMYFSIYHHFSGSRAHGDRSKHFERVFRRGLCGRSSQPEMERFISSSTLSQQYGIREISLLHRRHSVQSAERASLMQKTVHWWQPREVGAFVVF